MSTSFTGSGTGSVHSAGSSFAPHRSGSARFSRPMQLDQALVEHLSGGIDPEQLSEMSHSTANALLDHVRHTQDYETVARVLTLVEAEGIEVITELWSKSEPDTLPGILWRLYTLRLWMKRKTDYVTRLWKAGEPVITTASAIVGIDTPPTSDDIANTADSILTGAFTGDFAVALDRAGSFCLVVSAGAANIANQQYKEIREGSGTLTPADKALAQSQIKAAADSAQSLKKTAQDFINGAKLWRSGTLS